MFHERLRLGGERPRLAAGEGTNAGPQAAAQIRLVQQFGEARRTEHLVGYRMIAVPLLEVLETRDRVMPQDSSAVRGSRGGGVWGGAIALRGARGRRRPRATRSWRSA